MATDDGDIGLEWVTERPWWAPDGRPQAMRSRESRVVRMRPGRRAVRRAKRPYRRGPSRVMVQRRAWRPGPSRRAAIALLALCGTLALLALTLLLSTRTPRHPAPAATPPVGLTVPVGGPGATPDPSARYPAAPGGPAGGPGAGSASLAATPRAPLIPPARPANLAAAPPVSIPSLAIPNPLDPGQWTQWAKDLFNALVVQFFKGILDAISGLVGSIFGAIGMDHDNMLLPIPPAMTYDHPVVRQYQGLLIGAANAGLACVLAFGGLSVILKDRIGATYHDAMELLPRFLIGAAFVNLSREPGRLLIDFANAAIAGVGAVGAPGWGALPADVKTIGDVLLALFYLVALLCLVLQVYLRLVLVDLLLILTPLAMLAWILPQTQEIARRWTNALASTVAIFFVQSLALKVGGALLQAGLTDSSGTGALASLFLSGAFFILLFRLPGLVSQHIGGGGGAIARIVLTRMALGAMAGGGRAGRAGAGARP